MAIAAIHPRLLVGALTLLPLLVGCGGEDYPETIPVRGTVTYEGKPLPDAEIGFYPADGGSGNVGGGTTDANGIYKLTTFEINEGARPGEYDVIVQLFDRPITIPAKYANEKTTPLKANVSTDQKEVVFDIVIDKSDGPPTPKPAYPLP